MTQRWCQLQVSILGNGLNAFKRELLTILLNCDNINHVIQDGNILNVFRQPVIVFSAVANLLHQDTINALT